MFLYFTFPYFTLLNLGGFSLHFDGFSGEAVWEWLVAEPLARGSPRRLFRTQMG